MGVLADRLRMHAGCQWCRSYGQRQRSHRGGSDADPYWGVSIRGVGRKAEYGASGFLRRQADGCLLNSRHGDRDRGSCLVKEVDVPPVEYDLCCLSLWAHLSDAERRILKYCGNS